MATKSSLEIHSTYYESLLALSVCIRVNKHHLKMETHTNQAPVLRYRDTTITSETLRDSLAAVCPVLGVHNVARVRRGTLALFELDFTDEKALKRFCKSMDGKLKQSLSDLYYISLKIIFNNRTTSKPIT